LPNARLDLASLESVRLFAKDVQRAVDAGSLAPLSTLVLNAGLMRPTPERSVDGAEMTIAANHLGHHALATALLPALRRAATEGYDVRVVVVTSSLHHLAAHELLNSGSWRVLCDFSVPSAYALFRVRT